MNSKNYIILTLLVASFLCSCNKSEEYPGIYRDGCLRFNAKILSGSEDTRANNESTAVYSRDTIFVDSDVYVTASVDNINSNTVATRGVPLESELQIPSLKVNVIKTVSSTWASGQNRVLEHELSMPNTSGGNFDYSPLVSFLRDGANRTFIAYSPMDGTGGVTKKSMTELNYTVPADATQHPDLCTSKISGNTDIKNTGSGEHIRDFELQHELTAIGFALRGSGVKIVSATITGVKTTGTLNLENKVWALGSATEARAAKTKQQFYNVGWTESWVDCTEANGYLMMIPQTLTDAAKLTIVYQYDSGENKGKNLTLVSNLKKLTGGVWAAGKRISYNIRLKADPVVTAGDLLIDCSLGGYTTTSTVNMGLIQNIPTDDVLTFTWDASWLKIHQGSPKENNTSGGATSGWSAAANKPLNNLYFFASNNNPSAMTRTATVTVRGKKSLERTFKVTQNAKPTLSVYPTSLTVSHFKQSANLQITTNGDLQYMLYWLPGAGSWVKLRKDGSATLPLDFDWQINPGNRSKELTLGLYEKGEELAAEVTVPITQKGSGRFLVLSDDERSVRSYVDQYNSGTVRSEDRAYNICGKDGWNRFKRMPKEALWRTILDKYVFTGRWENGGNLGGVTLYWTDELSNESVRLGKDIDIDWKNKRYNFNTNRSREEYLEKRCTTQDGSTP